MDWASRAQNMQTIDRFLRGLNHAASFSIACVCFSKDPCSNINMVHV